MTDLATAVRATLEGRRLVRFAAVGALGACCDYAVLFALVEFAAAPVELAKVAGAECSIVVMFAVNERWTFARWGASTRRDLLRRLVTSNAVRVGGIAVSVVVLSALVRGFDVHYLLANAVGIGAGFVVNYLAENLLTWRVHE